MVKVIKMTVSETGNSKEIIRANLSITKAAKLREKLNEAETIRSLKGETDKIVSYMIEGI